LLLVRQVRSQWPQKRASSFVLCVPITKPETRTRYHSSRRVAGREGSLLAVKTRLICDARERDAAVEEEFEENCLKKAPRILKLLTKTKDLLRPGFLTTHDAPHTHSALTPITHDHDPCLTITESKKT